VFEKKLVVKLQRHLAYVSREGCEAAVKDEFAFGEKNTMPDCCKLITLPGYFGHLLHLCD
jgi:hypothetical protein